MGGRHELKYFINGADQRQLRARLQVVAKPDMHAGEDGTYKVRSLYFDNYADKAVTEKLSGLSRREKFRLRFYQDDLSLIRLERKSKANQLSYKESEAVSAEQCAALLAGQFDWLKQPDKPLFMDLYIKMRQQNLRPRCVVEYYREAYTFRAGNVRITFDSHIRTTNHAVGFLSTGLTTIPASPSIVLEVKYDGFLPDVIRDILQITGRNQSEFSKYVASRLV